MAGWHGVFEVGAPRRAVRCDDEGVSASEVMALACRVMRDDAAHRWMRLPNVDLDDETPLDVVEQGGEERVSALLWALAEGITA